MEPWWGTGMQGMQDWLCRFQLLHDTECVLDRAQMCILMAAVKIDRLYETPCNGTGGLCAMSCSVWRCGLCGTLKKCCDWTHAGSKTA